MSAMFARRRGARWGASRARLRILDGDARSLKPISRFQTAISLHCHTQHSRELLDFIPHYAAQIPLVSRLFQQELTRYQRRHGRAVDFTRAWWTPPVSPRTLLESEQQQIAQKLGMQAFVSITDHDDIEAPSLLQVLNPSPAVPISLEWTVPFGIAYFHLGVHNLPAEKATILSDTLLAFTRQASDFSLGELLEALHGYPGVLIVLNHPFWDIECIGQQRHEEALQNFLLDYGQWIHALEINGFRPWRENGLTMALASKQGIPIISGGDRHGCQPNTTLNVTAAQNFDEFAAEVRDGVSEVILLPEYREPMAARMFESSAEILREYPNNPGGQQRWTERVFIRTEAEEIRPLSHYWPHGGPVWVRSAVRFACLLGSPRFRPAFRLALSSEGATL